MHTGSTWADGDPCPSSPAPNVGTPRANSNPACTDSNSRRELETKCHSPTPSLSIERRTRGTNLKLRHNRDLRPRLLRASTTFRIEERNYCLEKVSHRFRARLQESRPSSGFRDSLAEFERDVIRDRTMAGLAAARARGRVGGRPKIMTDKKVRLAKTLLADHTNTIDDVCETLGVSRATLYRYLKE